MTTVKPTAPTLLLIDDSITELRVLIDMLAARQWRTLVSFDGMEGYRKTELKQPNLILLDVRMPGMDGFATCRRLKANVRTAHIPVIFLTAADDKDDRLTGLGLGAVDYIIKPYASEEEVLARVSIHLEMARRLGSGTLGHPWGSSTEARRATDEQPPTTAVEPSGLVRAATGILLDDLANPPSPEQLACQLGTNEKRLNETFQATFALPVMAWLREQRLRLARQLLVQTATPVADIALHCGYSSSANFATAFKLRFDCTPRELRQRRSHQAAMAATDNTSANATARDD